MADGKGHPKSYNGWPNFQGFTSNYQEKTPVELQITGDIPSWTAGVLYRTGTGATDLETEKGTTFKVAHWFDAFSITHRFQILPPDDDHPKVRVIYNSRSTCDGLIERIHETGNLSDITFGRKYDPCMSFFQKVMSHFRQPQSTATDCLVNVTQSVNFPGLDREGQKLSKGHASGINTLCNRTDTNMIQMLDPESLEPVGIAEQSVLHPDLRGPISSAHAKSDPATGDVYNYNLEFGKTPTYRIFHVSASTGETSIIATIPNAEPAYLHSFFLTENYIILCVWNSVFAARGLKVMWSLNIIDALQDYDPSRSPKWYVIDRRTPADGGKGVLATYESDPFYCFHTINAYETPSPTGEGTDIIADLVAYDDLNCLKTFYLPNLISTSPEAAKNKAFAYTVKRFRLPFVPVSTSDTAMPSAPQKARLELQSKSDQAPELPVINPRYFTRKHRYVYGIGFTGQSSFFDGLVKFDTETKEATHWFHHGQNAGEAIFIPRPREGITGEYKDESEDEDDGVLLSVVLDGLKGKSYLLVLDAKTMSEVGRADVDGPIGFGFHGTHVGMASGEKPTAF